MIYSGYILIYPLYRRYISIVYPWIHGYLMAIYPLDIHPLYFHHIVTIFSLYIMDILYSHYISMDICSYIHGYISTLYIHHIPWACGYMNDIFWIYFWKNISKIYPYSLIDIYSRYISFTIYPEYIHIPCSIYSGYISFTIYPEYLFDI